MNVAWLPRLEGHGELLQVSSTVSGGGSVGEWGAPIGSRGGFGNGGRLSREFPQTAVAVSAVGVAGGGGGAEN